MIDGRSKLWILHERFEFRGEGKTSAAMAVKERFFPRAVSREEQPLAVEIEQCEGEHSVQLLQAIEIPLPIRFENDLGICGSVELMAELLELQAKFLEVVNLTVERNP